MKVLWYIWRYYVYVLQVKTALTRSYRVGISLCVFRMRRSVMVSAQTVWMEATKRKAAVSNLSLVCMFSRMYSRRHQRESPQRHTNLFKLLQAVAPVLMENSINEQENPLTNAFWLRIIIIVSLCLRLCMVTRLIPSAYLTLFVQTLVIYLTYLTPDACHNIFTSKSVDVNDLAFYITIASNV